jgi:hypothetical protein
LENRFRDEKRSRDAIRAIEIGAVGAAASEHEELVVIQATGFRRFRAMLEGAFPQTVPNEVTGGPAEQEGLEGAVAAEEPPGAVEVEHRIVKHLGEGFQDGGEGRSGRTCGLVLVREEVELRAGGVNGGGATEWVAPLNLEGKAASPEFQQKVLNLSRGVL